MCDKIEKRKSLLYFVMTNQSTPAPRLAHLYGLIARGSLYLLVLLVPIAFLPWTVDALEVNKQTVTVILSSLAVIAWLGMMVAEKQFFLKKSWLFALPVAFLVCALISSALSIAPVTSWIGQSTQEYTSFISLLSFVLLFIVGGHFLSETKTQRMVWSLSFIASGLIGIFSFLALLGIPTFNTLFVGTPNALGFYLATMAVIGSGLWLVARYKGENAVLPTGAFGIVVRAAIVITIVATIFILLALDFWSLWIALIVGLIVIFTFALLRAQEFPHTTSFILPMLLFVVSLLFLFLPSIISNKFPVEVSPSMRASWDIASDSLEDSSWLFGSGPGTFVMDYTKFKPQAVNATRLWDARFDRGTSQALTMLATFGIVGTALFIVFLISLAAMSLKMLITEKAHDEWKMTFVTFAGWSVLVFAQFVYTSNFTLSFMFWLLSAVLISQIGRGVKHVSFQQSPRGALLTTFLFVLVTVGLLTAIFVSSSRYAAEIAFAKAVQSDRGGDEIDGIITDLDRAARLNKWHDGYYRNLSSALLAKSAQMLQEESPNTEALSQFVQLTVRTAQRAVEISPDYVVNWSILGDIYRELSPIVGASDVSAIQAYERAIELAPSNPKYRVAQARAYLIRAEGLAKYLDSEDVESADKAASQRDEALNSAVTRLQEAVELKPDYGPAHYYLALAYERQGNLAEAISSMENLRETNKSDVGIHFQLGLLYLKQGKNELAQTSLERAVDIAPNFSNARWYLSAVYEQDGEFDKAIEQVEAIKQLNQDNTLVDQRLERLKEGKAQDELPKPLEEGEEGVTDVDEPVVVGNE